MNLCLYSDDLAGLEEEIMFQIQYLHYILQSPRKLIKRT
jgi:hypothetical protein